MKKTKKIAKRLCSLALAFIMVAACISYVAPVKSGAAGSDVTLRFNDAATISYFANANNLHVAYSGFEEAVLMAVTGADPYVLLNVEGMATVSADTYKYVAVTYMSPSTNSSKAVSTELFMSAGSVSGPTAGCSVTFTPQKGHKYVTQIIDMSSASYWTGTVHNIRVDAYAQGDTWDILYLSSISFCQSASAASAAAAAEAERANGPLVNISEATLANTAYDLGTYTQNYWEGNVVYNESVYPLLNADGSMSPISLMYDAKKIVSVRNSRLNKEYRYGVDYTITADGKLQILTTGSIPTVAYSYYYTSDSSKGQLCRNGGYLYFTEGPEFHNTQLAVTYVHEDFWEGDIPLGQLSNLPVTKSKLENKQHLTVVFNGDSITYGCNASGLSTVNAAPYMPLWTDMTVAAMKSKFGYSDISYANTAVGGTTSEWGAQNVYNNIAKYVPDLVFIGFGMNDGPLGVSADTFKANLKTIINTTRTYNPNAEFILVQTMYANPESYFEALQSTYTAVFEQLVEEYDGVAYADLRTPTGYLLFERGKRHADMTGNNVNHPNDFVIRLYTQVMMATLSEPTATDLTALKNSSIASLENYVDLNDYLDAEKLLVQNAISAGTANINAAETAADIKNALSAAKAEIDEIKTAAEYEAENLDYTCLKFNNEATLTTITSVNNVSVQLASGTDFALITPTGSDPYFTVGYANAGVSADTYKYVTVVYHVSSTVTNTSESQIFFTTSKNPNASEDKSVKFTAEKGTYAYKTIDLSEESYWTGNIKAIRIDPFQSYLSGDSIYLHSIYLSDSDFAASAYANKTISVLNGTYSGTNEFVKFESEEDSFRIGIESGVTYVGDIDGDGEITLKDHTAVKKHIIGIGAMADASLADVNGDGMISLKDTLLIKKAILGMIDLGSITSEGSASYNDTLRCAEIKTSSGDAAAFTVDVSDRFISADSLKFLSFVYNVPVNTNVTVSLVSNGSDVPNTSKTFVASATGQFRGKTLDYSSCSEWTGEIDAVRFEFESCEYMRLSAVIFSDDSDGAANILSKLTQAAERFAGRVTLTTGMSVVPLNGSSTLATCSYYTAASNDTYTYSSGLTMVFENQPAEKFNRITLKYTASTMTRGVLRYRVNGNVVEDEFFLEAASSEASFGTLITTYFNSDMAAEILSVTLYPISASSSTFSLKAIVTETIDVFGDTYYLESDNVILGIYLAMGGGVSYYEVKNDGNDKYDNLLNSYDVGRLVQQSYYGTNSAPYEPGYYQGTAWRYNPVQGGDLNNNPSRIVNIETYDNAIYVKTRPMDWAKNGSATPSYMENLYIIFDNFVKVENRFVDFSGYTHTVAAQELPAFYTISALDTFSMYSGSSPWTGGAYTSYSNLGAWYDTAYHNQQDYTVTSGNENWFAWHDSTGFGIALYVPGVTNVLAGRHAYDSSNPSCDPLANATNYFAPIRNLTLVSGKPLSYSYLIAAGNVATVRETFKNNRGLIDNSTLTGY